MGNKGGRKKSKGRISFVNRFLDLKLQESRAIIIIIIIIIIITIIIMD